MDENPGKSAKDINKTHDEPLRTTMNQKDMEFKQLEDRFKEARKQWEDDRQSLGEKITQKEQEFESLKRDLGSKYEELRAEYGDFKRDAIDHKEKNQQLVAQNRKLEELEHELRIKLDSAVNELNVDKETLKKERELRRSSRDVEAKDEQLTKALDANKSLEEHIDFIENQMSTEQKERETSQEKVRDLQLTITGLQADTRRHSDRIQDLEKKLQKAEDKVHEQTIDLGEAQKRIDTAREQQKKAESAQKAHETERDTAYGDSQGISKQLNEAKDEIERLNNEVERLNREVLYGQDAEQNLAVETKVKEALIDQIDELQQSKAALAYTGDPAAYLAPPTKSSKTLADQIGIGSPRSHATGSTMTSSSEDGSIEEDDDNDDEDDEEEEASEGEDGTITVQAPLDIVDHYIDIPGPVGFVPRIVYLPFSTSAHNAIACALITDLNMLIVFIEMMARLMEFSQRIAVGVKTHVFGATACTPSPLRSPSPPPHPPNRPIDETLRDLTRKSIAERNRFFGRLEQVSPEDTGSYETLELKGGPYKNQTEPTTFMNTTRTPGFAPGPPNPGQPGQPSHPPPGPLPLGPFPPGPLSGQFSTRQWKKYLHGVLRPVPCHMPSIIETIFSFLLIQLPFFIALYQGWEAYKERHVWIAANDGTRGSLVDILHQRKTGYYGSVSNNWFDKLWWTIFVETFGMNVNFPVAG